MGNTQSRPGYIGKFLERDAALVLRCREIIQIRRALAARRVGVAALGDFQTVSGKIEPSGCLSKNDVIAVDRGDPSVSLATAPPRCRRTAVRFRDPPGPSRRARPPAGRMGGVSNRSVRP